MTSAVLWLARKCMSVRFRKKFVICSHDLPFCVAGLTQVKRELKRKRLGHWMMHGKAIWKPGVGEITKAFRDIALDHIRGTYSIPYEPPVAMFNMLTHVRLWPRAVKLSPSWKMEVSKTAWIKPWSSATKHYESGSTVSLSLYHIVTWNLKSLENVWTVVTGLKFHCELVNQK